MRWQGRRKSQNVEDRRGRARVGKKTVGGIGGLIIAAIMAFVMGDSKIFFNSVSEQVIGRSQSQHTRQPAQNDQVAEFTKVIMANLEDTWDARFKQANLRFPKPVLVLYEKQVKSACGFGSAASGPFYCPADQKIYLDLSFLNDLKRLGAPGDFAFAYVIAHEYGHHISNVIGSLPKVHEVQRRLSKRDANQLSILLELQADCFAGVWAYYANRQYRMLEAGDMEEGLQAAASVGDDALIGNRPEKFTHGTSKQRMHWLNVGMQTGDVKQCDTFAKSGIRL